MLTLDVDRLITALQTEISNYESIEQLPHQTVRTQDRRAVILEILRVSLRIVNKINKKE